MKATRFLLAAFFFAQAAHAAVLDFALDTQTSAPAEWSQHGFNAQRVSYNPATIRTPSQSNPWQWSWSWNGPNASGGVATGKKRLPRNVQPVTGDGRVYMAHGDGVVALNAANGTVVWDRNPGGTINSTVAYDRDTNAVFVVSTNGTLYKLNAVDGATLGSHALGATSSLPLPPAIAGDRVFAGMGGNLRAVNKQTMSQVWSYATGSTIDTPPAYSPSRDVVIVVTEDLYVHAVNNSNGTRKWRVLPPGLPPPGEPRGGDFAEVKRGWPVIAEEHGFVLVKLRFEWDRSLWVTYPTDNASIRSFLQANPDHQALQVLDLDDGSKPFIANVGHAGYGNGDYMPMGFQPAVAVKNGKEVAYILARGETTYDPRWDSHLGEMVLDDNTASGFIAGYFRYLDFDGTNLTDANGRNSVFLTDEQPYVSAAGDFVFANHWEMAMYSLKITDRSGGFGTYANPIKTLTTHSLVESQDAGGCNNTTHFATGRLANTREYPNPMGSFHYYCGQGSIYDRYWSEYAQTVVSNGLILNVSCSGSLAALSY